MKPARRYTLLALVLALFSCKRDEKFPALGTKVASPVDVAVSDNGQNFYVLNSDFDRTYNAGSLLVLDADGKKITAVPVPRMGRTLTVSGNDLLVTIDVGDDNLRGKNPDAEVMLFDITDTAAPNLKARFPLDCDPLNAVMQKGYEYFAVSCFNGRLFVGKLEADRSASTLKPVRQYAVPHRAMLLDAQRGLLLAFPFDTRSGPKLGGSGDLEALDKTSFDADAREIKTGEEGTPNEIPDTMERSKSQQSNKKQREIYQFVVYDIKAESAQGFPERTALDPVVEHELHWLYFNLYNFDGTPDDTVAAKDANFKYYRTNFWQAQWDGDDSSVFYLSHRGLLDRSPFANNIIRATIVGDLRPDASGKVPVTSDVMTFDRVYGFKGVETTKFTFPGDFIVAPVNGEKLIVVNNFRDLVGWSTKDTFYSVSAKLLNENNWFAQAEGSLASNNVKTFYQLAMTPQGRILTGSYYGNSVIMLDVVPGVGITEINRIE